MPPGGARNRSGPQPDENSLRSTKNGHTLAALPADGYAGEAPDFPLPPALVHWDYFTADKRKVREVDDAATKDRQARELQLWAWAWRTPQAFAWKTQPWRWHTIAMWVRTAALCESPDATSADKNGLHRFADQIGLTPAGLKENGWKIGSDKIGAPTVQRPPVSAGHPTDAKTRLQMLQGGQAV